MFCRIQCLDITRFPLSSSTTPSSASKTSVNVGISPSFLELQGPRSKTGDSSSSANLPNGGIKRIDRFRKKFHPNGASVLVEKRLPNQDPDAPDPDGDGSQKIWVKSAAEAKSKAGLEGSNLKVGKVHAKCSTKWSSYGGCIPAILKALEDTRDLDAAFWPWKETLSNKERSIILKEQSSWERALEIFEWFKMKGCYELNVIHYNIMLRVLGRARRWGELESLCDEMRRKNIAPINSTYGTLIDVYSKGGLREKAMVFLQRMTEEGMHPDEVTMGIVVQMYKKAGEFKKAELYFKTWSKDEPRIVRNSMNGKENGLGVHLNLNSYTYNTLIDTYGKAGQLLEASETFERMLKEGVVPDTVTLNTMIHMYGNHGRLAEVGKLVEQMEQMKCHPDTRTYNILISLYAKHDDIFGALRYFMEMKKKASLEPDVVSYRTLLYALSIRRMVDEAEELIMEMDERGLEVDEFTQSALTRMYIEAGMLEKSWKWFERFHLQGKMTSECYAANIDAYGERGHLVEAERAFLCCQDEKKSGVLETNVMIKAYGIANEYLKACRLFDSMNCQGLIPDRCTYVSLILMLAGADLPHIAKPYLEKMQESGLVDDCIPYCAVISSFAKLGQLDLAVELYKEMINNGVQPDVVVYGVLINAFTESGNVNAAMDCVDTMKKAGLPLNTIICKTLIKLYTKVGYLREAVEMYKFLESSEDGPDVYASNCMIDLYTEHSMTEQAEEVFKCMQKRGEANEFSFAMMLCMYKRLGRLEEATEMATKMQELGLLSELLSYNSVIGLFALDGRFKEAVGMFEEMVRLAIQPDDSTFRSLGAILLRSGVPKQAVSKMDSLRKKDAELGLKSWMSALNSVVGGTGFDDAGYV